MFGLRVPPTRGREAWERHPLSWRIPEVPAANSGLSVQSDQALLTVSGNGRKMRLSFGFRVGTNVESTHDRGGD